MHQSGAKLRRINRTQHGLGFAPHLVARNPCHWCALASVVWRFRKQTKNAGRHFRTFATHASPNEMSRRIDLRCHKRPIMSCPLARRPSKPDSYSRAARPSA